MAFKKKLNQVGDTIVEVMICLAIIAMVISGAYASASESLRVGQRAQERTEALKLAEAQLEKIKYLSSSATSDIYTDPALPFCIINDSTKIGITNIADYTAASYNACLQQTRYHVSVVYTTGDNLFTVQAVWERLGGSGGSNLNDKYDQLKLFYRQPPDLKVSLSPTPTVFTTPTPPVPTPTTTPGPGGSTCVALSTLIELRYDFNINSGWTYNTNIVVPAGNLTVVSYESRDDNYNGSPSIETEEQWRLSVSGARSAPTTDVPDVDNAVGYRSATGSLPAFNQTGGSIVLEHRNVQDSPASTGINNVYPNGFCFTVNSGGGGGGGGGGGSSACSTPNPFSRLVYHAGIPVERTINTGIVVPAGNLTVTSYESRDHNYNGDPAIQIHEQWHLSVGGTRSADTTDVPDVDNAVGYRSVTGSLPTFYQTGGEIILEHRDVIQDVTSVDWNSVNPYVFCYTVTPTGGNDCEWSIVRSILGNSFLGNETAPTPGTDAANASGIIVGPWTSPNATVFISGLSDSCAISNIFNVNIHTDGAWSWANPNAFPDAVEVGLRRKSNPTITLPLTSCPNNPYYNANPPGYSSSGFDPFTGRPFSNLCYIRNLNGGSQVISWNISSANGNLSDLELVIFADSTGNASGTPEIVYVEDPIL